jgi:erythronate-4-phosphate dehydrogenase
MKIVADHKIPFLQGVFEPYCEVQYIPGNEISNATLLDADALLTRSITQCNAELLGGTSVKLIASATIGDDHIDKEFCRLNNIRWTTAKGCNAKAVEQYVYSALFALSEKSGLELFRMTIGIVGVGTIGSLIEKVVRAIGMKVLLNDPPRARNEGMTGFVNLNQIQKEADIITLHVPLLLSGEDKTFNLIDRLFFEKLERPVILINTSRGQVIDSKALKDAINNGKVKHCVLDVWQNEPDIDHELLRIASIGTPHIAGYSVEGKAKATEMIVKSVSDFFNLPLEKQMPVLDTKSRIIKLDCKDLNEQQCIIKAILAAYNILDDDKLLRNNPSEFEKIRGNYKFRRENSGYSLDMKTPDKNTIRILREMGFKFLK